MQDMQDLHQMHSEMPPMRDIPKPEDYDVLSGRGVSTNRHPGNVKFRSLVALNKELYVTSSKRQKMAISRSIVNTVRTMNPPGRFLEKNPATGRWSDIGDRKAVEKTSQALRDGAANLRKQLSADLGDPEFLKEVFDEKEVGEKKDIAPKSKPGKAKTVKKGHRRIKSNPDSLTALKYKAHMRKRKPVSEHPLSPSGSFRRTSIPSSLPTSPSGDQIIRTARTFDGDSRSYWESPQESYGHGYPHYGRSPSFEGSWTLQPPPIPQQQSPSLPPRSQWHVPPHRSNHHPHQPQQLQHPSQHEIYRVTSYPPPPMNHATAFHQPQHYFEHRAQPHSGEGPWNSYYGSHPSTPAYSPARSIVDNHEIGVPELQKIDSHTPRNCSSPLLPRNTCNPYRDPMEIHRAPSAEDFIPPVTPCRAPRRPPLARKEIVPSVSSSSDKLPATIESEIRSVESPATASESSSETDNPANVQISDDPDPPVSGSTGMGPFTPEIQVSSNGVEAVISGDDLLSADAYPSDEEGILKSDGRSLSPLPFDKGFDDSWMDITQELLPLACFTMNMNPTEV